MGVPLLKNRLLDLKSKLVNIDRRNTSLLLRKCIPQTHFDISDLTTIERGLPERTVLGLLQYKTVTPVRNSQQTPSAQSIRQKLYRLKDEADFIESENGSYEVYLGWPFAEGTFPNGDYFRAPMLLVPVRLKTDLENQSIEIEPDENRQVKLNRTLLLAFHQNTQTSAKDDRVNELDAVPGIDSIPNSSPAYIIKYVASLYENRGMAFEKADFTGKIVQLTSASPSKDPKRGLPTGFCLTRWSASSPKRLEASFLTTRSS